jgi:hypothetical protein
MNIDKNDTAVVFIGPNEVLSETDGAGPAIEKKQQTNAGLKQIRKLASEKP